MAFGDLIIGVILASIACVAVVGFSICLICRYVIIKRRRLRRRSPLRQAESNSSPPRGGVTTLPYALSDPYAGPYTPAPLSSRRAHSELQVSVISSVMVAPPSGASRPLTSVSASDDCPQCSYLRPLDNPPPSYFDIVPRETVEELKRQIFDPPSYDEASRTSRPVDVRRHDDVDVEEEEEQLPSYTEVFDRNGCYVNYGLDSDEAYT